MEVGDWLERLGLGQYAQAFRDNDIDVSLLPSLSGDDLKELGVRSLGHRKRILEAIGSGQTSAGASAEAGRPATAPLSPSGERRPVAVLFADLCGYTALSSRLDAEEIHSLLQRYFGVADRAIVDNGGRVDKHIGDSVMGVFGAPVAHRDDAARAARAAMAILSAMPAISRESGFAVETHVGLAFGEVVASATGSADHTAYTVTGEPVNLAARLTSLAAPGEACLDDDVAGLIADEFNLHEIGLRPVKGLDHAVRVWRLTSMRTERRTNSIAIVGRRSELAQIDACLVACARNREAVHLHLRGEAGIGKSRLTEEAIRLARGQAFHPIASAFLDFGAEKSRSVPAVVARGLAALMPAQLGEALASPEGPESAVAGVAANAVSAFREFAGSAIGELERARLVGLGSQPLAQARIEAFAGVLNLATAERPVLLVIEDVHWADRSHLDVVVGAFRRLAGAPLALLTTSRFENDPFAEAAAANGSTDCVAIELSPLEPADLRELAQAWAASEPEWAADMIGRSGGNPLFLERLLRHRAASDKGKLPDSIQSLVLAEVDRLTPEQKRVIQAAAVLGQSFSPDCLAHVASEAAPDLAGLAAHRMLIESSGEWKFAHALVRDAVSGSLLGPARRALHARAAKWYASRDAALHAQHLAMAGDPGAGDALVAAAAEAVARHDLDRALSLATTARNAECTAVRRFDLAGLEARALLELGRTSEAVAAFETAIATAVAPLDRARLALGLAGALRVADQIDRALALIDEAQPALEAAEDWRSVSALWHLRGNLFFPRGRMTECQQAHHRALDAAEKARSVEHMARALGGLGDAAYAQGRIPTARRQFSRCVDVAREAGLVAIEASNGNMAALCRSFAGPLDGVLEEALAAVEAAARIQHARAEIVARHAVMCTLLWRDDAGAVRTVFDRAQALSLRIGAKRFAAENLAFLAEAERMQGRSGEARRLLDEALALCRETGMTFIGPTVLGYVARCAVDDAAVRTAALDEADALLADGGLAHNYLFFGASALDACLETGDWDRAERYVAFLDHAFREEPMPFPSYLAERGRVLAGVGRGDRSVGMGDLQRIANLGRTLGYASTVPALTAAIERRTA